MSIFVLAMSKCSYPTPLGAEIVQAWMSLNWSRVINAHASWPKSSLDLNVAHGWTSELEDASACLTNARANLQDRELTQRSGRDVARRRRLEGFGVVLPDT